MRLIARFREGRAVQQFRFMWPLWPTMILFFPLLWFPIRLLIYLSIVSVSFYLAWRVRVEVREGAIVVVNVFRTVEFDLESPETTITMPRRRGVTPFDMVPLQVSDKHRHIRATGFMPIGLIKPIPEERLEDLRKALKRGGKGFKLVE